MSAYGQRGSMHNIDETWRVYHEWLPSTQVILIRPASLLNYRNYVSYLLQNPHVVIKTRIHVYNIYFQL
jgi:hypothetical protein